MSFNENYEKELTFQAKRRRATVEFISIISDLWYDDTVDLVLFRNQLINRNVSQILHLLEYSSDFVEKPISIVPFSLHSVVKHADVLIDPIIKS